MMTNAFLSYKKFIDYVVRYGKSVAPRGLPTLEVIGTEFVYDPTTMFLRPKFNKALAWAESMMLVGGVFDKNVLQYVAPKASHDLFTTSSAYGPRVDGQIQRVIEKLKDDPDTREATLLIAGKEDGPTQDQPCTMSIQFLLRRKALYVIVTMRSQDLVRGLPYDLVMFGFLTQAVASELEAFPASVSIRQGSAHIYTADMNLIPTEDARYRFKVIYPFSALRPRVLKTLQTGGWTPTPNCVLTFDRALPYNVPEAGSK